MSADEVTVRPSMTAREAMELHLLVDGLIAVDELRHVFGPERREHLTRARRALHGALRGAGYVMQGGAWGHVPQPPRRRR